MGLLQSSPLLTRIHRALRKAPHEPLHVFFGSVSLCLCVIGQNGATC